MDDYDDRATVGEMGEAHHAIRMMGEYTAPGRLHQCYSFEMMGYDYSAEFFRSRISDFFTGAPNGWPMWAFSNHDVVRHASRWAKHGVSLDALARQAGALLLSFQLSRNVASQSGAAGSVLESYRAMLAFRRATDALITGDTQFLDLPEPILGFVRGGSVMCLFNLSPNPVTIKVAGVGELLGPSQAATLSDGSVALGGNGYAFLSVSGQASASA